MTKKVKVIALETNEVLFETQIHQIEKAYQYAAQMDEMGIDVKIEAPTINETLADSLGLSIENRHKLAVSIAEEMEDHDGSCCAKPYVSPSDKLQ